MRIILAILLGGSAWACAVVEGDRIGGADLAWEHASFQALDAAADLGPAPAAGARRIFRASELQAVAARFAITLPQDAPLEACFDRATSRLNETELMQMLTTALSLPGAHIEIVDYTRNALPLGKTEFLRSGLSAGGLWQGSQIYGNHRTVPIWARVRITGPDGETIARWRPATHPDVQRGDQVHAEVRSGGVLLTFDATAESSAHVGEGVVVRNPANGQRFRAIVEARGKVTVQR
jgi:hypothetical protein